MRQLWIYKCNARPGDGESDNKGVTGDWYYFFEQCAPGQSTEWGGSTTMGCRRSLGILWNQMAPGDIVLAWQTDLGAAVAICRVARLVDWRDAECEDQRDMELELIQVLDPPVELLEMRKSDPALAKAMSAFRRGFAGTLYATSARDAKVLLEACHAGSAALLAPRPKNKERQPA